MVRALSQEAESCVFLSLGLKGPGCRCGTGWVCQALGHSAGTSEARPEAGPEAARPGESGCFCRERAPSCLVLAGRPAQRC